MTLRIGSHLSVAGGMFNAVDEAITLGFDALQVFTRNQRQWTAPPLTSEAIDAWKVALGRTGWKDSASRLVSHNSYLVNFASPDEASRQRSIERQCDETDRCESLGIGYCVMHPGAHLGEAAPRDKVLGTPPTKDELIGLRRIVKSLDATHRRTAGASVVTCLESTAGGGTNLGYDFAHLAIVLDSVKNPERVGVCLDTCHMVAAGYDFSTAPRAKGVLDAFQLACGDTALRVLHANDSVGERGSRKDRHEHIGDGACGEHCFRVMVRAAAAVNAPVILETPKTMSTDGRPMDEINAAQLRSYASRAQRLVRAVIVCALLAGVSASSGCRRTWKQKGQSMQVNRSDLAPGEVAQPTPSQHIKLEDASKDLAGGDYARALAQFREVLRENPLLPTAWIGVGDVHVAQQQWKESAPAYQRATKLDVNNYDAFYGYGMSLHMLGQYVDAVRAYHRAISLRPNDVNANISMTIVYLNMGEPRAAVAYGERAVRIDPKSASARTNLGVAYERCQRPSEAVAQYNAALELAEPSSRLLINLINALTADNRTSEAVLTAEELVRISPRAESWERLGWVRFKAGDWDASEAAYREGTVLDSRYYPCWNGIAINAINEWIRSKKGDADAATRARNAIQHSLEINPDQRRIMRLMGQYDL